MGPPRFPVCQLEVRSVINGSRVRPVRPVHPVRRLIFGICVLSSSKYKRVAYFHDNKCKQLSEIFLKLLFNYADVKLSIILTC